VRKAARLGTPFLVALPTYGYNVAFDSQGKYLGISAEGPSPAWPDRATIKELAPDPLQLSQLVAEWTRSRPSAMRGVIWYRLPNSDDRLNWRWPTLASVMAGKPPQPDLQAEAIRSEEGSIDLALVNNGSGEFAGSATVQVDCENAKLLAADALAGFDYRLADHKIDFAGHVPAGALPPGGRLAIGWVRLSQDTEVKAHVETTGD
jgi:hypothetical protein